MLADVDSSVGGKVGINHAAAKNLIGSFYQPLGVFIDTSVLTTLPERDYLSGMAEVVQVRRDPRCRVLRLPGAEHRRPAGSRPRRLRYIIARSCQLKADVVEHDEYERTGLRAVLNYGHTFAHVFEALAGYGELLHGEAVSIGMLYASLLAEKRGLIDAEVTARQRTLIESLGMISRLPSGSDFAADAILDKMKLDKKPSPASSALSCQLEWDTSKHSAMFRNPTSATFSPSWRDSSRPRATWNSPLSFRWSCRVARGLLQCADIGEHSLPARSARFLLVLRQFARLSSTLARRIGKLAYR